MAKLIPTPYQALRVASVPSDAGHHHHTSQQSPLIFANPGSEPKPQALVRLRRPMLNDKTPLSHTPISRAAKGTEWTPKDRYSTVHIRTCTYTQDSVCTASCSSSKLSIIRYVVSGSHKSQPLHKFNTPPSPQSKVGKNIAL